MPGGEGVVMDRSSCGRARLVMLAALAAAVFSSVRASADDVFRGDADIVLGADVHAAFPSPVEGPHRYTFFATAGTTVSASVRRDAGASLVPELRLTHPGAVRADAGRSGTR